MQSRPVWLLLTSMGTFEDGLSTNRRELNKSSLKPLDCCFWSLSEAMLFSDLWTWHPNHCVITGLVSVGIVASLLCLLLLICLFLFGCVLAFETAWLFIELFKIISDCMNWGWELKYLKLSLWALFASMSSSSPTQNVTKSLPLFSMLIWHLSESLEGYWHLEWQWKTSVLTVSNI